MIYFDLPDSSQKMVVKTHTEIKTAKLFCVLLCTQVDSLMHF